MCGGTISGAIFVPGVAILTPLLSCGRALADPALPSITGSDNFTVTGLVNDATETPSNDNTNALAIENAIATCAADGGGTITVPSGTYFTNGMYIPTGENGVDLQILGNVVLASKTNYTVPNGENYFIYWKNARNDEISGDGVGSIYGQGETWWPNTSGPNLVNFSNPNAVEVTNITLTNSPHEFFSFTGSTTNNVTFNEVTINAPGTSPNTDGIDPSGNNFLITNCNISTGDDDISPKAETGNSPVTNLAITNDVIGTGHGLSIGSSTSLGMSNITVNNVTFNGTVFGLRMKSQADNGGVVQNVSFNNITMTNVFYPVYISSWYNGTGFSYPTNANSAASFNSVTNSPYTNGVTPLWENISYNNITSTWTSTTATNYKDSIAGLLYGLPSAVIQNVNFNNVNISAYQGMSLAYAGTASEPISFGGNWSINVGTGQQFGTLSNPVNANVGLNTAAGNPGNLTYWNGMATALYDGPPSMGTPNFNTWETSNVVYLTTVPEPTTGSLAVAGSALMLMRRRRQESAESE
ncbi:MAG: glycosyl hydrolase family 28 protein [Tepidisphaeraceae bacterium]|jgi:polygalacturonase